MRTKMLNFAYVWGAAVKPIFMPFCTARGIHHRMYLCKIFNPSVQGFRHSGVQSLVPALKTAIMALTTLCCTVVHVTCT